jgi:glutamyl-tRNA synthetase/glutamyl-Q tRNA(Asp) synthetase
MGELSRFAPSTTGPAHPGTLLAALLCWLDARSLGAGLRLRLEDLDPQRARPQWREGLLRDLAWLGLDFDGIDRQSDFAAEHAAALDRLAERGRLYPCRCSRSELRRAAGRAEGELRYPGTCRARELPAGGWRATRDPLRVRLPEEAIPAWDEDGEPLPGGADPPGDPIVRRRDGSLAYQLTGVVDDARIGVTRIVRGRDLAGSTPTQVALQRLLDLPTPRYRHHLLLLEQHGAKLAKLHGAVDTEQLRAHYDAAALCGLLARAAGLRAEPAPLRPAELLVDFDWQRVERRDQVLRWTGERLEWLGPAPGDARSDDVLAPIAS